MIRILFILMSMSLIIFTGCKDNLFEQTSRIQNDDDYYKMALAQINKMNYDEAITILTTQMSAQGLSSEKSRELLASAHAGKCGLNFVDYAEKISTLTSGSLSEVLKFPFINKAVTPDSCIEALLIMDSIGSSTQRSLNQNLFTAITGMVLYGGGIRHYTDDDPILGDGSLDHNVCNDLPDDQLDKIIIGFGYMAENFSAIQATVVGNYTLDNISEFLQSCEQLNGASCAIKDSAHITPTYRNLFRDFLNTSDYGVGVYSSGGNLLLVGNACP